MKTIGICASGPSLTMQDCEYLKKHTDELIAVNDTWRMVNADHLYSCDQRWWHHHIHDINMGFSGKRWSCDPPKNTNWGKRDPLEWGVKVLLCETGGRGLSTDPDVLVGGRNSGYQAIGLAYHLGADRIVLLGYDMTWTGGRSHWFGNHPQELNNCKPDKYIEDYRTIKPEAYGLEIINCSRSTALDAFPCRNLEDVF
jgi:hypothetical protein